VTRTTHPHLVPRSRMSRSYTSSAPSASMACSVTVLPFTEENRKIIYQPCPTLVGLTWVCADRRRIFFFEFLAVAAATPADVLRHRLVWRTCGVAEHIHLRKLSNEGHRMMFRQGTSAWRRPSKNATLQYSNLLECKSSPVEFLSVRRSTQNFRISPAA
jgi:hypothetical protein